MASAEAIPREFSQGKEAIDNKIAGDGLQAKKDDDSGEALMMAMACESNSMQGQKKHSCSIIDLIQKEFGVDLVSNARPAAPLDLPARSCAPARGFRGWPPEDLTGPSIPPNILCTPGRCCALTWPASACWGRYRCHNAAASPPWPHWLGSVRARFPPRYSPRVSGRILTIFCLPMAHPLVSFHHRALLSPAARPRMN